MSSFCWTRINKTVLTLVENQYWDTLTNRYRAITESSPSHHRVITEGTPKNAMMMHAENAPKNAHGVSLFLQAEWLNHRW